MLAFVIGKFYLPILPPGGTIADPFSRKNESSGASGIIFLLSSLIPDYRQNQTAVSNTQHLLSHDF